MEVSAKKAKIWRKDFEGRNGTFHRYSVGVSRKNEDGSFTNAYIPVKFSKKSGAPEKVSNGALCDFDGFVSVESYTDKDGKTVNAPQIIIMNVTFDDPTEGVDSFAQAETDIPF